MMTVKYHIFGIETASVVKEYCAVVVIVSVEVTVEIVFGIFILRRLNNNIVYFCVRNCYPAYRIGVFAEELAEINKCTFRAVCRLFLYLVSAFVLFLSGNKEIADAFCSVVIDSGAHDKNIYQHT